MENTKFAHRRAPFREALAEIQSLGFSFEDLLHHHPALMVPGGVMILHQFNHQMFPRAPRAVRELLPDLAIRTFRFTNHPSAYVVKPAAGTPCVMGGLRE